MTEQAPPPSDQLDALKEKIPKAAQYYWRLHIRHSRFKNAMVTLSIILGAAAPFVGQAGHGLEAGIMASVIGAIVALQKHFRWAQRSDLYRLLHVEAKNLRDRLNFKVGRLQSSKRLLMRLQPSGGTQHQNSLKEALRRLRKRFTLNCPIRSETQMTPNSRCSRRRGSPSPFQALLSGAADRVSLDMI